MTRKIETIVYTFDELSEGSKERARDWYRGIGMDDYSEHPIDEFQDVLVAVGFAKTRDVYYDTNPIDGAFKSAWRASRLDMDKIEALIDNRPGDKLLHDSLKTFALIAGLAPNAYGEATASHRGRSINQQATVELCIDRDDETHTRAEWAALDAEDASIVESFSDAVKELSWHVAMSIAAEHEYQTSNEYIDDTLIANAYEFTIDGKRV